MKKQQRQKSKPNMEGKNQSWKTDTTQLQDLL